jgi:hypothetical protein
MKKSKPHDQPNRWSPRAIGRVSSSEDRDLCCDEVLGLQHLLVEGELDALREGWVLAHQATCEHCRQVFENLAEERNWVAEMALDAPLLSSRFSRKVTDQIRAEQLRVSRRRWVRRIAGILGTAAAALLLATIIWQFSFSPVSTEPGSSPLTVASGGTIESAHLTAVKTSSRSDDEGEVRPDRLVADGVVDSASHVHYANLDCFVDENECVDRIGGEDPCSSFDPASLVSLETETTRHEPTGIAQAMPSQPMDESAARDSSIGGSTSSTCGCSFGEVVVFTSWVGHQTIDNQQGEAIDPHGAPCPPDPNADGKTDGSDVAFYWQKLLHTANVPANASRPGDSAVGSEAEDEPCIRV